MNEIPVQNGIEKDADFLEVCDLFFHLQSHKAKRYGDSWCKHGEAISVFGNTSRKYDRVQNIIVDYAERGVPLPPPDSDESLAETVGDLGIYSILWMTYIKKNRPEEYRTWKAKIEGLLHARCSRESSDTMIFHDPEFSPFPFSVEQANMIFDDFRNFIEATAKHFSVSTEFIRSYLKDGLIKNVF